MALDRSVALRTRTFDPIGESVWSHDDEARLTVAQSVAQLPDRQHLRAMTAIYHI